MVYSLNYHRPYAASSSSSLTSDEKQKSIDDNAQLAADCRMCQGIPEPLSFDRIVSGGTCPPCTLREFMNYLRYIELAAENLQFFLWFRSYAKKFDELPDSEKALAPEWTVAQAEAEASNPQFQRRIMKISADTAAALKGTGLDYASKQPKVTVELVKTNPFYTPPRTPDGEETKLSPGLSPVSFTGSRADESPVQNRVRKKADEAYSEVGLKWKPMTIQPFRDEIARVVTIYIADGGPRQLNLSSKERHALLHALQNTTHPSAWHDVVRNVEWSLRFQAHPNFIRWTICNGNKPRVSFARGLGIALIAGSVIAYIILSLSRLPRGYRALAAIPLFIGICTMVAAWKGMCVVLHGMHHRHLRPWELFQDDDDDEGGLEIKKDSIDAWVSGTSNNSWEDEPWVAKYDKRNVVRKVFDRETWVEEPALRQIQDTIAIQSIVGAIIGTAILTAIFVAIPGGGLF